MFNKTVKFLLTVTLAVSMIVLPVTEVFALDGRIVDATDGDREEHFGNIKTSDLNDAALKVNVDNEHKAVVTTGNLEAQNASAVEIEAKTGTADVTIDGDAVSWDEDNSSYGVSLYAGEDQNNTRADVILTVKGNTQGATAGARIMATDGSTNYTVIDGSAIGIKNKEGDAFGLVVETRDDTNPGDREKAAKATVIVRGDCIATENSKDKGATIRGNGGFVDVSISGNVAGDTGMEVQSFFGGEAKVVVEGTVYGEAVGISLDAEGGENSDVTAWKVEAGENGAIVGNLVWGKAVGDKNAEKKIKYIIKVDQPKDAKLTVTDANGKALPTVTAANGKTFEYAHSGDKIILKADLEKGYNIDAIYGDLEKQQKLIKDESGNYCIEVPEGGGVYFSADLIKEGEEEAEPTPTPTPTPTPDPGTPVSDNSVKPDKVPLTPNSDVYESYASPEDNFAAKVPGASSDGTGGNIKNQELDFSNVLKSAVAASDLKMTTIPGSKFKTTGRVVDKSSVQTTGGVKAKFNKNDNTVSISCKSSGTATFAMEDGNSYTVYFTVEKPKPVKSEKTMAVGGDKTTKTLKDLFGISMDSGKLSLLKQKHYQAALSGNSLIIDPAEKDSIKIMYQYLNKKYKMTIKVK